jgi:hypothetical protein
MLRFQKINTIILFFVCFFLLFAELSFSAARGAEIPRPLRGLASALHVPIALPGQEGFVSHRAYEALSERLESASEQSVLELLALTAILEHAAEELSVANCDRETLLQYPQNFPKCFDDVEREAFKRNVYQDSAKRDIAFAERLIEDGIAFDDIAREYGEIFLEGGLRLTISEEHEAWSSLEAHGAGDIVPLRLEFGHYIALIRERDVSSMTISAFGYSPATIEEILIAASE